MAAGDRAVFVIPKMPRVFFKFKGKLLFRGFFCSSRLLIRPDDLNRGSFCIP